LASDFYDGEFCDRRLQRDDWCDAEGDSGSAGWLAVITGMGSAGRLVPERTAPVRETAASDATVTWRGDGAALVDSGRNDSGYLRLEVTEEVGRRVEVRYSEFLDPAGNLYRENLRGAACTDVFVCAGDSTEQLEPSFTYRGFRFAEISGLSDRSRLSKVSAVSISTDLERVGRFRSSLTLLEQIHALAECSLRSNYLEVPTDCPQRGERLGWMADASLFATFASYTYDIESFMSKWCDDILDSRSPDGAFADIAPRPSASWWGRPPNGAPGWTDAGVQLPWLMYQRYGDIELLDRMFPAIERWMRWLHGLNEDGIWEVARGNDYGDWVPAGPDTSHRLIATCWLHSSTVLARRIAAVLGLEEAEQWLAERGDIVQRSFAARFVDEGSGTVADPEPVGSSLARTHFAEVVAPETQTGYVMALWSGVVAGDVAERAVRRLGELVIGAGHRLETGIVGSAKILDVLETGGFPGLAYDLLLREDYPSLGFMVSQGSTSVWERWDGLGRNGWPACPTMNSFNHYALGSMLSWLVEGVCGLRPLTPGLREFRFAPALSRRVPDVGFELETRLGPISLGWRWRDDSVVDAIVELPAGATCRVPSIVSVDERVNGARRSERAEGGGDELVLGAGRHTVTWTCVS
jgi:alpha-L-rhamnosidase